MCRIVVEKKARGKKEREGGKSGWKENERERERYLSVVKQAGSIVPELIRACLGREKEKKRGKKEKKITAVKRARRLGIIVSELTFDWKRLPSRRKV